MAEGFSRGPEATESPDKNYRFTVAIVEDEGDLVDVYARLCDLKGLPISFIAYNGREAVDIFSSCAMPDVILMDHRMPALTGLEAMKKMREMRPEARFLFLSADEEVGPEAIKAGARAFLKKPVSLMDIYDTMLKVVREP
jgi:two-component system, chemotaxis family, chemotaxis protein CheY